MTGRWSAAALGAIGRGRRLGEPRQAVVDRRRAQERLAVDRREIEHQAGRLALGGVEHERPADPDRTGDVYHDAGAPAHDETESERLDDAPAVLAGLGRELEIDLGNVDDHPIGIGNGEGAHIDPVAEIDHEPGLLVVAGEAGVGRHRDRVARPWQRHLRPRGPGPKHHQAGHGGGSHPRSNAEPAVHHPKSPAQSSLGALYSS